MRRDKVFPAAGGVIKDIIATKIVLRDSSPWIMDIRLNQARRLSIHLSLSLSLSLFLYLSI